MFLKQAFFALFVALATTTMVAAAAADTKHEVDKVSTTFRTAAKVDIASSELETLRKGARKMMVKGSHNKNKSDSSNLRQRALKSKKGKDINGVLIKGMECAGCIEAPDLIDPVNVTPNTCDVNNDKMIWNLKSLEDTNTWFQFENEHFKNLCMTLASDCGIGFNFLIQLEECDDANPKAAWGFVGDNIYNFECFINENDNFTPDVLLEADCNNEIDSANLDFESLSSDDQPDTSWVMFSKDIEIFNNNDLGVGGRV